ncbi:MAG: LOG family protein [Bacteroidales bacterium]
MDELSEVLTYNQLRIYDKTVGLLNINGYFDHLIQFFNHAVEERFVREEHRNNIIVSDNAEVLLESLKNYEPVLIEKWIRDIKDESSLN